jgi:lysozyme
MPVAGLLTPCSAKFWFLFTNNTATCCLVMKTSRKRNAGARLFLRCCLVGSIAIATIAFLWFLNPGITPTEPTEEKDARFARYPGFNVDLPLGYSIHGIDVSKYQQLIHWPSVAAMRVKDVQPCFAFIKATEGLSNTDTRFKRNWDSARSAGITRGAYHFFLCTKNGEQQAKHFINKVKLMPGDLPPVLDVEQLYGVAPNVMRARVQAWLTTVEKHYGIKPIIYTYANFYQNYLGDAFNHYPLWVAHYFQKEKPAVNRPWLFWQHTEKATVNGIRSRVDFNVFNGDSAAFTKLLLQ